MFFKNITNFNDVQLENAINFCDSQIEHCEKVFYHEGSLMWTDQKNKLIVEKNRRSVKH